MFYSQFILAKKGPLGTIWIAAHLERKLRKNQVADTDIGVSVDSILSPDVPIALRLSSHLLLGVVRIYSRKVNYLFDDCSEALLKVKQAFRSAVVDLPPEESKAPYHSITLPETFDLDDFELPEVFQGNFIDHHVSTKEQITLQDAMVGMVYSTSQFGLDERFGDGDASEIALDLDEELLLNKGPSGHGVLLTSRADPKTCVEPSSSQKCDEFDEEICDTCQVIDTNCSIEVGSPSTAQPRELNLSSNSVHISGADDEVFEPSKDPNPEFGQNRSSGKGDFDVGLAVTEECEEEKEIGFNKSKVPLNSSDKLASHSEEADHNHETYNVCGFCSLSDNPSFVDQSSIEPAVVAEGMFDINSNADNKEGQDLMRPGASKDSTEDVKADMLSACKPVLQPCNFSNNQENAEVDNLFPMSKDCGIGSEEIPGMQDAPGLPVTNVQGCSIDVEDKLGNNSNAVGKGGHDFIIRETSEAAFVGAETDMFPNNQDKAELHYVSKPKNIVAGSEEISEIQGAPEVSAEGQDVTNQNLNEDHFLDTDPCNNLAGQLVILETIQSQKGSDSVAPELPSPEKMLSLPDLPFTQSNELLLETTPERDVLVQGDQDATMTNISGKKRSLTESTITLQSQNSVDTSEAAQSRRTVDFVPDDDDLLSSILVGRRSTVLKVKSTPPAFDLVSSKRPRFTPRSGAHKRKVLVDDSMVLHGDMIRQQLVNTEDIRRVRKKAPSTHSEIWILQKQYLEDEMFNEPIFTGLSSKLISLHCQPHDLIQTKLVEDDGRKYQSTANEIAFPPERRRVADGTEFEDITVSSVARDDNGQHFAECPSNTPVESGMGVWNELLGDNMQNATMTNSEVVHMPSQFDVLESRAETGTECSRKPIDDELMTNSEFGHAPSQFDISENRTETGTECRREPIDDESGHSVALAIESSSGLPCASENIANLVNSEIIQSSCIKDHNVDFSELVDGSCLYLDEISSGKDALLSVEAAGEAIVEQRPEELNLDVRLENTESVVPVSGFQPEYSLPLNAEAIISDDKADEGRTHELGAVDNAEFHESDLIYDDKRDDSKFDPCGPVGDLYDHDTDFLNFDDDDEIAEDDENSIPNAEGHQFLDNSGWSTRTRAVSSYLQALFHKEAQHGRTVLRLDNLLAKKSRKEASRMFFETLVLKTRDYIHVDQEVPFDNINIKPRARLLKSEF